MNNAMRSGFYSMAYGHGRGIGRAAQARLLLCSRYDQRYLSEVDGNAGVSKSFHSRVTANIHDPYLKS